jgi:hypothetical protein
VAIAGARSAVVEFFHCVDARRGDHAAVADHHHPLEPEGGPQHLDGLDEGGGVAGVALEHTHRHGRPTGSVSSPYSIWALPFFPSRE